MKRIVLYICLMSIFTFIYAKMPLNGIYNRIDVINDCFCFSDTTYSLIRHNSLFDDTLSVGTYKKASSQFIELTNNNIYCEVWKSVAITSEKQKDISEDSILIVFDIPKVVGRLEISFYLYDVHHFVYNNSNQNTMFLIPKRQSGINEISFSMLSSYRIPQFHNIYCGYISFDYYDNTTIIKNNDNYVKISIPKLDNSFFQQIIINHEYARMQGDTICWRGMKFVKKKN